MIRGLLLTFIPLFVAVDVVAVVLVYLGIGVRLPEPARRRLILEATITAAAVGLGFLFAGDAILRFLGVTVGDFQIAGVCSCWCSRSTICCIRTCRSASRGLVPAWARSAYP